MKPTCMECDSQREGLEPRCKKCGGLFDLKPDFRYRDNLPENFPYIKHWLSLGEVITPVVTRGNLSFKLDYYSPSFSYKDRGARSLLSFLSSKGGEHATGRINEDSSGNAGAAIAAYGSMAGFDVNIFVPENTSPSKIGQIKGYGASIVKVPGSREDVQAAAENAQGVYASHVLMPEFRDGIRTLAYEIFNQFQPHLPERVMVPVSAGTLLLGLRSGFDHLVESGEIQNSPEVVAVQTEQVSPLCALMENRPFDTERKVQSIADALVSMKPPLLKRMSEAAHSCITVDEAEIRSAREELAKSGIYAEYSSATVYAAQKKKKTGGMTLMVLTGNGLKNTPS